MPCLLDRGRQTKKNGLYLSFLAYFSLFAFTVTENCNNSIHTDAVSYTSVIKNPHCQVLTVVCLLVAYPASTPMPDQSYTRPSPSVDPSSYGRERPSAPPGSERGAPRRTIN